MATSASDSAPPSAEPSLAELRVFACAAQRGSFSAAARELGMTQQAVSARVRALERATGLRLFARSPQGAMLTEAGETVLSWAGEVLEAADRLAEGLATLSGAADARGLAVGASQTIAAHLLPGWLVTLRRQQEAGGATPTPAQLHTANSEDVTALVRSGTVDLGFIETPDVPTGLGHATIGADPLLVAVAPDHPWASRASISLAELASTQLVAREAGSGTRAAFEHEVARQLDTPLPVPAATLASEAAVRTAVAHGIAPAVVSALSVADDMRLGRLVTIPVEGVAPTRPLTAIWRGGPRDLLGARRQLVAIASASALREPEA